ncbi:MAG: hypothetical protein LBC88_05300 [Spirochaetaceae bacterium]|nr:hypothetical protein [Spirochaetaceae bacterium]
MLNISINGKTADITLEAEKTIGEVLSGIDSWLQNSGFRLNGLEIDGEKIDSHAVPLVFGRELAGIRALNIQVCAGSELALDALTDAAALLSAFGEALKTGGREEAEKIAALWESGAAASFLSVEFPELYRDLGAAFTDAAARSGAVKGIVEERIREIARPLEEAERLEALVNSVAARLEELPLDIQTGKDSRAAETVTLFSAAAEKLFRLYHILKIQGEDFSSLMVEGAPLAAFLEEFSGAVNEMLRAYQGRDLVLVGDLAEYELAPRLKGFLAGLLALREKV